MTEHEQRWDLLANEVVARRQQLRISRADLIRASGLSEPTIRKIEQGSPRGVPENDERPATPKREQRAKKCYARSTVAAGCYG